MGEDTLKPCPFCGQQPRLTDRASNHTASGWLYIVSCCCGGHKANAHQISETFEEVRKRWNTRSEGE